jgi:hypothetical protein
VAAVVGEVDTQVLVVGNNPVVEMIGYPGISK